VGELIAQAEYSIGDGFPGLLNTRDGLGRSAEKTRFSLGY